MLSFKCLFCLLAITITQSVDIESKYSDLNFIEQYYNYQIVRNGNKVDLKVYYESLCPDCRSFHAGALDDTYKKIGSYIDLKTYPYGNAKRTEENGKIIITCQHGPEECYGNKLHACAIDILNNVSRSEFYNSCMLQGRWGGRGSADIDATKCGQSMDIDSKPIIECAKGKKGEDLLEYYGKETDKLTNKTFVPWVLINGKFFDVNNEDLMKTICKALDNPPASCGGNISNKTFLEFQRLGKKSSYQISKGKGDKVEVQVYYECLCPGCKQFHTQDLHETYTKLGSYIDLKNYPYGNARRHQEDGKTVIKCQHGPDECYGNKLHACAIDILNNVNQSESYVTCMMECKWGGKGSTDMDATKCGELMKIDPKPIIDCANGEKGETLLEYYGKETDKTNHNYVPWVLINGKLMDPADDFFCQVCDVLTKPPPDCKDCDHFERGSHSYQTCYND